MFRMIIFCLVVCFVLSSKAHALEQTNNQTVESFNLIVGKFDNFFKSPQKIIYRENYSESPSGGVVYVIEYSGVNLRYDIKKTDSMISPFTAFIELDLTTGSNGSCGNVSGYQNNIGWDNEKEALEKSNSPNCYKPSEYVTHPVKFGFAYQNNKWILKSVVYTEFNRPDKAILSALDLYQSVTNKESIVFNSKWMNLIK